MIGDEIIVAISWVEGRRVQLVIEAPKNIPVYR
jgi:sRNA-binding carbon storage regulator CsrA